MPPPVLTEEEIQVIQRMIEHVDVFIKLSLRTIGHRPSDDEVKAHLYSQGRSDMVSWITPVKFLEA